MEWIAHFQVNIAGAGLLAWAGTAAVYRHATRLGLVQIPNIRSSHAIPTPQGGGVGIVLGGSLGGLWPLLGLPGGCWALLGLGLLLAATGFLDDWCDLSAQMRLAVQFGVCAGLLVSLGPLPSLTFGQYALGGTFLALLLILAGIWWINLFNFMDGIDGIAGSQAIFMLVAGAGLSMLARGSLTWTPTSLWMAAIAAATAGFLCWNWPPARIFLGDVGSTYLAFMILGLALLSVRQGVASYQTWLILGGVFVTDATVTIARRLFSGQKFYQAHRSHAYQRLSRRLNSHRRVTLMIIAVNCLWLGPLAAAVIVLPHWGWGIVGFAYTPLVACALLLGAGKT